MKLASRALMFAAVLAALSVVLGAQPTPTASRVETRIQLGNLLLDDLRYWEAIRAFEEAQDGATDEQRLRSTAGMLKALLPVAEFTRAQIESQVLLDLAPSEPEIHGSGRGRPVGRRAVRRGGATVSRRAGPRPRFRRGASRRGEEPDDPTALRGGARLGPGGARSDPRLSPPRITRWATFTAACAGSPRRPRPTSGTSSCSPVGPRPRRPTGRGRRCSSCGRSATAPRSS